MAQLYTYYFDFLDGREPGFIDVYDNTLEIVHRRDSNFFGINQLFIEGSLKVVGENFDRVINSFKTSSRLDIYIFKGGVSWRVIGAREYCDIDYNEKVLTLKSFPTLQPNDFTLFCKKNFTFDFGGFDLFDSLGNKFTDNGFKVLDLIDEKLDSVALGCYQSFDKDHVWFNESNPYIFDFTKLRIVNMKDFIIDTGGGLLGGSYKSISFLKIFQALEAMFNIYTCYVSGAIKFKMPAELISNTLDLADYLVHKKEVNYDKNKEYGGENFTFNDNNLISSDPDFIDTELKYNVSADNNEYQLQDFTTLFIPYASITSRPNMDSSGWFLGWVNTSTERLESENGYVSEIAKDNAKLSPANRLNESYRNNVYCNTTDFTICGNSALVKPDIYKQFIEVPDFITVIDDALTFYDSIILEKSGSQQRIGIVTEQRTKLSTNQTTFKCFEISNNIGEVS